MKILSFADVKTLFPHRKPDSHKGENGRVLVIGGHSEFSGAHVLCAMGALYAGCDIVRLFVPRCNVSVARSYCPEFIVRGYEGDVFKPEFINDVQDFIKDSDCVIIGPGSKPEKEFLRAVKELVKSDCKFVLDSNAIGAIDGKNGDVLGTPHKGEFEKFFHADESDISTIAKKYKINVLLKGPTDIIASSGGEVVLNKTGNAGMTVGGSGDVLAGVCGSFAAQGIDLFNAAQVGAFILGKAGDNLKTRKGVCYTAKDLAEEIPYVARDSR